MAESALGPLQHRLFVWMCVANALSALGTWIQSTASAWVVTELTSDPLMVSLVQAAAQLPIVLLALPAGALADRVDRRRYLIATNLLMLGAAGALALLYALGIVAAWGLIGFTALLAAFAAMHDPAWAASVPLTVPREELPQALVLNSIGFNLARALGPALGGLILASAGAAVAFLLNAASFAVVAVVLGTILALPQTVSMPGIPPERTGRAVLLGLHYATAEPSLRVAVLRTSLFSLFGSAVWALLPLYVRDALGETAEGYGAMLAATGAGAVIGGALMPYVRKLLPRNGQVIFAGILTGAAMVSIALAPAPFAAAASLCLFGFGWILGTANLQAAVQLACAPWIRARGLALYQVVFYAGMGSGAVFWGAFATSLGLIPVLLIAGIGGVLTAIVAGWKRLPNELPDPAHPPNRRLPSLEEIDRRAPELARSRHPVFVIIDYEIRPADVGPFRAAMKEVAAARRRTGAVAWRLARDLERADHWVEAFRVPDWNELRRGIRRVNFIDDLATCRARAFHSGRAPPEIRILMSEKI